MQRFYTDSEIFNTVCSIGLMRSPTSTGVRATSVAPVSYRVVEAVAREEGVSPADLDQPLNDVVDPDALNALFSQTGPDGAVEFTYHDYTVVVDGTGRVHAESASEC